MGNASVNQTTVLAKRTLKRGTRLTEFELREGRVAVRAGLYVRRLVRLAVQRLALPCALGELCEVPRLLPCILRPAPETD